MEPPKSTLNFGARVASVEEKFVKIWLSGFGDNAQFKDESRGWFVGLEGSHELLFAGMTKPNIEVGDKANIRITFHALSSPPPEQ
jgi:hypothetical protein